MLLLENWQQGFQIQLILYMLYSFTNSLYIQSKDQFGTFYFRIQNTRISNSKNQILRIFENFNLCDFKLGGSKLEEIIGTRS